MPNSRMGKKFARFLHIDHISTELKAWRKEKELGIDKPLQVDIPIDLPPIPSQKKSEEEKPPAPMEVVRF